MGSSEYLDAVLAAALGLIHDGLYPTLDSITDRLGPIRHRSKCFVSKARKALIEAGRLSLPVCVLRASPSRHRYPQQVPDPLPHRSRTGPCGAEVSAYWAAWRRVKVLL